MKKMLIGIVVIALIVNCQLALAQVAKEVVVFGIGKAKEIKTAPDEEIETVDIGLTKVIETIKAAKGLSGPVLVSSYQARLEALYRQP